MSSARVRAVVFLDEELVFLKRLRQSGKLINLVMQEAFRSLSTEREKVVAAIEILDGRISLKVQLAEVGSQTRDPQLGEARGSEQPNRP